VVVVDIGIPEGAPARPAVGLIKPAVLDAVPHRAHDSTKFAAGSVLVCGGSTGLTGAPSMAAESAMRAGAGYVTVLVPASLNLVFEVRLLEAMSVPLPDRAGALTPAALDIVLERAERADALVLGPGLGRDPGTFKLARRLARRLEIPVLLDADGLNAHAGRLESLADRRAATVLTPHAGELARLLDCESGDVAAHRLRCVRTAAAQANAIVLLKGDDTIVAAPDGRAAVSRGGAPALATAGTGDVLSGVIGAYLSKGMDAFDAACAGVFLHARAGRIAARTIGTEGVVAGDVIDLLPRARSGDE
jgi:ADP-dependent NAD(P)H-hydrate dehydratase / NAD(P)H-hydrate epimerase